MVLLTLSRGKKSLYELSKILSTDGRKKSSGTLLPIMRRLEKEGYVKKDRSGRIRYYSLTESGRKHTARLRKLSGQIRRTFLKSFMKQEVLMSETKKGELLLSPEFVERLEVVYETLGEELTELISLIMKVTIKGDVDCIERTKDKLRKFIGEVRDGVQ